MVGINDFDICYPFLYFEEEERDLQCQSSQDSPAL